MDDASGGFLFGLFIGAVLALLVGLIAYGNAEDTVRQQAIAAKVGKFVANQNANDNEFVWGCEVK